MSNLLTKTTRLKVLWQRRLRLIVSMAAVSIITVLVTYIAMLPVFAYTYIMDEAASTPEVVNNKISTLGAQRRDAKIQLEETKDFINSMQLIARQSGILPILSNIIEDISTLDEVILTRVDADYTDNLYVLSIAGTALYRSGVVSAQDILSNNKKISLVSFPISNFAPSDDVYNFTAKIEVHTTIEPSTIDVI